MAFLLSSFHCHTAALHLPTSLVCRGLIHLFLPSYLGKAIVASLPPELGQYVVEANEDVHFYIKRKRSEAHPQFVSGLWSITVARAVRHNSLGPCQNRSFSVIQSCSWQAQGLNKLLEGPYTYLPSLKSQDGQAELSCRLVAIKRGNVMWLQWRF
eukprot:1148778-Pelagomonas_calceolata.AAC.9